jgi:fumarate reductase flavoprotein subunit
MGAGATAVASLTAPAIASVSGSKTDIALLQHADPIKPLPVPAKWDHEADIVVVGGGGAGLSAAVSATEHGAKVIVIEKNAFCGGDTSIAMCMDGMMGSRLQIKLGMKAPSLAQRVMTESDAIVFPSPESGRNATLVRQVMESQADTANWLEDMGVVYSEKPVAGLPAPGIVHSPINPEKREDDWFGWHPHNARGFTEALEKRANTLGVVILKEHPAAGLICSNKHVVGIAARNADGKIVYLKAKAVLLATGGFGANRDMMKKYLSPERAEVRYQGMPSATGDGIRMAQAIGAEIHGMDAMEIWSGGALREGGATTVYSAPNQLAIQKSLTVNKRARRFYSESVFRSVNTYKGAQILAQPDQEAFTLFDANTIRKEDLLAKFHPMFAEYPCAWFDEQFEHYVKTGVIKKTDSIPELAKLLGIDPDQLVKTVNRYNELCDAKEDKDFFKEAYYMHPIRTAPFYGVGQKGASGFNTHGGLVVDDKFHVLDKQFNPIPGLFVAGENAAGGACIAYVLPGGRLAGRFAASEALGKAL